MNTNRREGEAEILETNDPVLKALVVDDEQAVRDALKLWLGQRQFSVRTAFTVQSAVMEVLEHDVDVILLDVKLAAEDGLQLVSLLRALGLDIPIVVFTAHAGPYDGFKAHELGVVELLEKPSLPDRVAFVLRRAAAMHRTRMVVPASFRAGQSGGEDFSQSGDVQGFQTLLLSFIADPEHSFRQVLTAMRACLRCSQTGSAPGRFRAHSLRILKGADEDARRRTVDELVRRIEASGPRLREANVAVAAATVDLTGSRLRRLLAIEFDLTFVGFRRAVCVREGVIRLAATDDHVAQIAYQLSYPQPHQLDLDFRLCLGVAPSRVRALLRQR